MTRTPTSPPRWAVRAAHLVSLVVLPSALWRLPLVFGFSMGALEHGVPIEMPLGERVYILGLSVVTELAALSTLGLVRPWGERFPPRLVLALASFGVVALAVTWGFAFRNFPDVEGLEFSHDAWHVLLVACYMPLLLWAPLLAAVTYDYYRRHARRKARTASGTNTAGRPTSQASAPSAGSSGSPTPSESPRAASTTSEIG